MAERGEPRFRCRVIDAGTPTGKRALGAMLDRHLDTDHAVEAAACAIVDDVRRRGDRAVIELTRRFDGAALTAAQLRVTPREIAAARRAVPAAWLASLERAHAQIVAYHARQVATGEMYAARPGVMLGHRVRALDAVGIYVPGGRASYPSTVLMNAVPAVLAGVGRVAMVTPPAKDGSVDARVLAAASVAGVHEVYRVGGAQAIAALAYGTKTIAPVDKIVGPGNAYVTAAKRIVYGRVGIDGPAGPSEVVVVADKGADPHAAAADLLAQAEHDPDAFALAFVVGASLARAVAQAVEERVARAPRRAVIRAALAARGGVAIVRRLDDALAWAHRFAPEHLVVLATSPRKVLPRVGAAGSIFLGPMTPVTLGDYLAGPNHVLPTAGAARFSSGLSVRDFVTVSALTLYSREALLREADDACRLAEAEGLFAHAEAVRARLDGKSSKRAQSSKKGPR